MDEVTKAVELLKSCGLIICVPAEPSDPIPEPEMGQLWVAPGARVTPRRLARVNAPYVVEYFLPGENKPALQSRGSFLAWARRCGARPVLLPVQEREPVQEQAQARPAEKTVLPWWKRVFGARSD